MSTHKLNLFIHIFKHKFINFSRLVLIIYSLFLTSSTRSISLLLLFETTFRPGLSWLSSFQFWIDPRLSSCSWSFRSFAKVHFCSLSTLCRQRPVYLYAFWNVQTKTLHSFLEKASALLCCFSDQCFIVKWYCC